MNSVINDILDTFFPIRTEIKLTVFCPYCERSQFVSYDVRDALPSIVVRCVWCEKQFVWRV